MSRHVASLVYRKRLGSIARKAIMAYCAERANDDGSGIWASKVTISKEVECSKQTVIDTMRNFVTEGLMIEVGKRKCANGFVVEYSINVAEVRKLEDAISEDDLTGPILDPSSQLTPRGQASGPQEVKPVDPNRPLTVLKPSIVREADFFAKEADEESTAQKPNEAFERFWKSFPKKAGKPAARKAWDKAVKRADPELIIQRAAAYAETDAVQRGFAKHPQGWLNDDRWNDADLIPAEPTENRRARLLGPQFGEVVR